MDMHSLVEEDYEHLKSIIDKTPFKAQLRLKNKTVDELTEEDEENLKSETSLSFIIFTLGVKLGTIRCYREGSDEEAKSRWDIQLETMALDRFAAASRHRDWKHGIIGKSIRAVWTTAETLDLAVRIPSLADLLHPKEFSAVRYDASRDKEKDRYKDIPLVNVSATGGGSTPLRLSMTKSNAKAK